MMDKLKKGDRFRLNGNTICRITASPESIPTEPGRLFVSFKVLSSDDPETLVGGKGGNWLDILKQDGFELLTKETPPPFKVGDRVRIKIGAVSGYAGKRGTVTELLAHGIIRVQFTPGGYALRFFEHEVEMEAAL